MHRTIGFLSKRFVHLRPGEGRKVALTFSYFFLVITAYYVIKPVSRSLVLGELGSRMVPYVDFVCALLMGPVVTLFARLVDRLEKPRLVSLTFWAVIAVILVFWKLLAWPVPWIAGAFYVWVAIFSVLVVTLFWLIANDLYHPREARRLFGFIGSGGILGGIVGSSIAAVGAQMIGTQDLLLLSAALLLVCWLIVQQLWKCAPDGVQEEGHLQGGARKDTCFSDPRGFFGTLVQSRYLLYLVVLVGLNKLIATLVYYQLNPFIEQTFTSQDARTTFTGIFFGGMNVAAFVVQFFFTSWVLRRWGLLVSLLALPVGVLIGTTGLLFLPVFWMAAVTELYDGSLNYSLQQTAKELLYLPIDRSIRYKVKPFIDMVVFRFGKGIAAVIGILATHLIEVHPRFLSALCVPLLVGWVVVAVKLRYFYVVTIRMMLQARALARRSPDAAPSVPLELKAVSTVPDPQPVSTDVEDAGLFGSLMNGQAVVQKLALVGRLIVLKETMPPSGKELISELTDYEMRPASNADLGHEPSKLRAIVWDELQSMSRRRQALRLLARSAHQATVDYLLGLLVVQEDVLLRREALIGLARVRIAEGRLEFPLQTIRRLIMREVESYQRIGRIASICRSHRRGTLAPDDPILGLLRLLMEETIEQVFRLLMLLYRPEDIHLVYEQLRSPDAHLRADAVELLDNLVDPRIRTAVFPILDEDRFLAVLDDESFTVPDPTSAYRTLQEAIWDHNCWLSVTTLCAVSRLRMTTMYTELEKAARHTRPPISTAAKVALHLQGWS